MQAAIFAGVLLAMNGAEPTEVGDLELLNCVRTHEVVIRAKVVEVGVSPGWWSGAFISVQRVRYVAVEVIKGDATMNSRQITVNHVLVGNGPWEDREPGLRQDLLKPDVEVVLFGSASFLEKGEGIFVVGDDRFGIMLVRDGRLLVPAALPDKGKE